MTRRTFIPDDEATSRAGYAVERAAFKRQLAGRERELKRNRKTQSAVLREMVRLQRQGRSAELEQQSVAHGALVLAELELIQNTADLIRSISACDAAFAKLDSLHG